MFSVETVQTAFGVFGYGGEVLRLDDDFSRDHHWSLRINAVMPDDIYHTSHEAIRATVGSRLPVTWRGHALREGYTRGGGLELASFENHLNNTIGLARLPVSYADWRRIPEGHITTSRCHAFSAHPRYHLQQIALVHPELGVREVHGDHDHA